MDVATGKKSPPSEACKVKVRVALGGSVFDNITRFTAVWRSSAVEKVNAIGVMLMAAKSKEGSDTDHHAFPELGRSTIPVKTKSRLVLTLLLGVEDDVIATAGADAALIVTVVDAVADRSASDTRTEKVDVVLTVCSSAATVSTDFMRSSCATVKLHFELYDGTD